MTFRVGQKVVFIGPDTSGSWGVKKYGLTVPKPNEIYTIRGFLASKLGPGYYLQEIVNPPVPTYSDGEIEIAINAEWLRPLVERKTDISFAHEILRKATKPAPALAQSLHKCQ